MRRGLACCTPADLPGEPVATLGGTSSARIATLVKDVVTESLNGGLSEIRMSDRVLNAVLALRSFLFEAVYENTIATARVPESDRHPERSVGKGARVP